MQNHVTSTNLPGILMLLFQRSEMVMLGCVGVADVETHRPVQAETIYRIASMTKPVASVAAMMLVEEGKLRLDDPVARYIPEFGSTKVAAGVKDGKLQLEDQQTPMTVFHTLTHTAGVPYEPAEPLLAKLRNEADIWNTEQNLEEMMRRLASVPLAFQPGSKWDYGMAHDILSRVVEVVGEMPFDQFLDEKIFGPLRMKDTAYYVPDEKADRVAHVYEIGGAQPQKVDWPLTKLKACRGGAGLFSTALDYLRFCRMLLNKGELDGVRLLKPETVAQMTSNQLSESVYPIQFGGVPRKGEGYGLGVGVVVEPENAIWSVPPGTYMWGGSESTHFWIDPSHDLIGIILAQFEPYFHIPLDRELVNMVYEGG